MIQLYNADCFDILKTIPSNSVDLILTDPPYEHTKGGKGKSPLGDRADKLRHDISFMSDSFDMNTIFPEFMRVCKIPNMLIFCSNRQISSIMSYFENCGCMVTLLCWIKTNPIPATNGNHLSDIEFCVYVRGKGATFNTDVPYDYKRKAYISGLMPPNRFHPAQKPDALIRRYLSVHTNEGDTVLDCFMGSGTTGVWCKKLNRNFIGIEIDPHWYEVAQNRINGVYQEYSLF